MDVQIREFMNEQTAWQEQTEIQTQYQQLLKRDQLKKVALTACMRKFLTILISSPCGNAMLRDEQPFRCAIV